MQITRLLFCIFFVWHNYESLANSAENPVQQCYGFCDLILDHNGTEVQEWNETETRIKTLQDQITKIENQVVKSKLDTYKYFQIGTRYFRIETFHYNWFSASASCRESGGQLAVIHNEEELNALNAKLDENRRYWLDINDLAYEGQFVSWTSGKRAPYLKWWYQEPNNANDDEDCVILWKKEMWDEDCSTPNYSICQSDVEDL